MATDTEIKHRMWKRSWWDGSIIGMCGQRFPAGHYREAWTGLGPITCPGCRAALGTR